MKLMSNPWGWSLRGIRHWLSCWAWPYSVHGVEVTSEVAPVERTARMVGSVRIVRRLMVIKRIVKIGPLCFEGGRFTSTYDDNAERHFYDATGVREIRYPYGRIGAWQNRRWRARIDRDNRRRADDKAMREGWS